MPCWILVVYLNDILTSFFKHESNIEMDQCSNQNHAKTLIPHPHEALHVTDNIPCSLYLGTALHSPLHNKKNL